MNLRFGLRLDSEWHNSTVLGNEAYWWWWWLLLYSAILRSRAGSLRSHVILREWLAFYSAVLNIRRSGVLTALAWLTPHETAAVSAQVLCTPINHVPCHFMQSHIRKMYVCLAVTCHLHFWQNDRDLVRATAVTRGWKGFRKLTLEKKILPPLIYTWSLYLYIIYWSSSIQPVIGLFYIVWRIYI